jgi:Mrp family chromosome partitioning ATPase
MPTDHSIIKWACDLCGAAWTGPESRHAAETCEATGAPEPLPDGTWVLMNGYAAGWDAMTTGGFRLMKIDGHKIKNTHWMAIRPARDPEPHIVDYGGGAQAIDSAGIHPHLPGVLNLRNIASPALHDDRINTLLRYPDLADEFCAMLAAFGVTMEPAALTSLADDIYGSLDFGWRSFGDSPARGPQSASALPPLASLSPELQAAIRAVAEPKRREHARRWETISSSMEVMHHYREARGNIALATARLLTGYGESLESRAQRWWAGEDVELLSNMLTWAGGDYTKGGNWILTVEQRDALRDAGFTVPWPARARSKDTINSPSAALEAILKTIAYKESPVPDNSNLFNVGTSIAVASGKGGVGKTTVAAALAKALTRRGKNVLAIDLDFHGPSLGHLLGLGHLSMTTEGKIIPTQLVDGTRAVSLSQFLTPETPVTWRGTSVEGFLLFLAARLDLTGIDSIVFDLPPGTGDVERAVMKYARPDGAILVTTGSDLSHADCRRAGKFLQHHKVPILGVVENLSRRTVITPTGETVELRIFGEEEDTITFTEALGFHDGRGQRYAPPYLGSLPFTGDPDVLSVADEFTAVTDSAEKCEPERVDPDRDEYSTYVLTMSAAAD